MRENLILSYIAIARIGSVNFNKYMEKILRCRAIRQTDRLSYAHAKLVPDKFKPIWTPKLHSLCGVIRSVGPSVRWSVGHALPSQTKLKDVLPVWKVSPRIHGRWWVNYNDGR